MDVCLKIISLNSQAVFVEGKFCDLDQNVSSEKDKFCAFFIIAIFHKIHLSVRLI